MARKCKCECRRRVKGAPVVCQEGRVGRDPLKKLCDVCYYETTTMKSRKHPTCNYPSDDCCTVS